MYRKRIKLGILFYFVTVLAPELHAQNSGPKAALLVGIADYPVKSGWQTLSSVRDVDLLHGALIKRGFTDKDIITIKDSRADIQGIRNGLRRLYQQVQPGSFVYIHFSAHGQRITDDNGDETDGYDEAIVCIDAPISPQRVNRFDLHLRDDELGRWIDSIRHKAGKDGDVFVVLDACYSGSGTRGGEPTGFAARNKVRGSDKPFGPPAQVKGIGSSEPLSLDLDVQGQGENYAGFAVFSASRHDEKNYEYGGLGSLSQCVVNAMAELQTGDSYRAMFSKVCSNMAQIAPHQNPVAEGMLDRTVFAGKLVAQQRFFTLSRISASSGILMNGGTMMGLGAGTKVALMQAGSPRLDSSAVLAYGEIVAPTSLTAGIRVSPEFVNLYKGKHRNFWVFITEQGPGIIVLPVFVDPAIPGKDTAALMQTLRGAPALQMVNRVAAADIIIQKIRGRYRLLFVQDQSIIDSTLVSPTEVREKLESFLIGKTVRGMRFYDPSIQIELSFIPVRVESSIINGRSITRIGDTLPAQSFIRDGVFCVSERDHVVLRVENKGSRKAYFNIIDIQPDNKLNPIIPVLEKSESPATYMLEPGQVWISGMDGKYQEFGPPYGNEIYRVFATTEPVDLTNIYRTRGNQVRHRHSLERVVAGIYQIPTTRSNPGRVITPNTNTSDFHFRIIE
jgi:metacaspase-1